MHEDLRLDAGVAGDLPDLLETQLAAEHRAGAAELGRGLHAGEVVDAHLRAGVQRQIRHRLTQQAHQAEILHEQRVRPVFRRLAREVQRTVELPVGDERVHRDIDLAAADVAIAHGLDELFLCEIIGSAPRVVRAEAEINRVRPVLHRRDDGVGTARGRKQFQHSYPRSFCPDGHTFRNTVYYTTGQGIATRPI